MEIIGRMEVDIELTSTESDHKAKSLRHYDSERLNHALKTAISTHPSISS